MLRFRLPDNSTFTQGFKYSANMLDVHKFVADKLSKDTESLQLAKYPNVKLQMANSDISSAGFGRCCSFIVDFK